jgi:hypothetical protein
MNVELSNPSAFHPLRVYQQDRLRSVFIDRPTAAPLPKRETREELNARGSKMVMVPSVGTARENGMMVRVTREVPTPVYATLGYSPIEEFCTEVAERQLREFQAAASAAAMLSSAGTPRGQRVVDEWKASPQPLISIPPGEKRAIDLEENKRVLIESDEEVGLQIQNESKVRTLRLRNRDSKSGEQTHVAFLAPLQVGLVIANGRSASVIELMPQ